MEPWWPWPGTLPDSTSNESYRCSFCLDGFSWWVSPGALVSSMGSSTPFLDMFGAERQNGRERGRGLTQIPEIAKGGEPLFIYVAGRNQYVLSPRVGTSGAPNPKGDDDGAGPSGLFSRKFASSVFFVVQASQFGFYCGPEIAVERRSPRSFRLFLDSADLPLKWP